MIHKRDFLKSGATALVAGTGAATGLAAVRPSLGEESGLASWQAQVGQRFVVDGHVLTLQAVRPRASRQPGEQFSASFEGLVPTSWRDGMHQLMPERGEPLTLYLARTPQGLRADFCRLRG